MPIYNWSGWNFKITYKPNKTRDYWRTSSTTGRKPLNNIIYWAWAICGKTTLSVYLFEICVRSRLTSLIWTTSKIPFLLKHFQKSNTVSEDIFWKEITIMMMMMIILIIIIIIIIIIIEYRKTIICQFYDNLRSGIIIFFCFFVSLAREGKK